MLPILKGGNSAFIAVIASGLLKKLNIGDSNNYSLNGPHGKNVIQLLKLSNLIIFTPSKHKKEHEIKLHKPIWPVLDVSLLGLYLLSFNDFLVRWPVKSWSRWGAVWTFCASGKYKFSRRLTKRAETVNYFSAIQNWHPVSTALVSSKMNTTGTKTFTSEWVLFGRLIITMWDRFDCVLFACFYYTQTPH